MKHRNRKPQHAAEPARESWRRVIAEWATVLVVYLFVSTCVVQGYVISTPSMENTLLIGDHLWVDKLAYAPGGDFLGRLTALSRCEARRHCCLSIPVEH